MANTVIMKASDLLAVIKEWTEGKFVVQESGKGLSTEDFTAALKDKLDAIASGAEVNTIVAVKVNNTALTPDSNRAVNIDLSGYALKSDISSVYRVMGNITYSSLIALTTAEVGDVYNVTDKGGHNYVCITAKTASADAWDDIGGTIDLSTYYTKSEVDTLLGGKADSSDLTTHTGNTDIHVTSSNKSTWNAKYDKPSGGIPKTDLASAVQTSLGKADSALQSSDVDNEISSSSTNPVQNKVVYTALGGKANSSHTHTVSQISDLEFMTQQEALAILNATT